ncbi:Flp pilus assembly protein CpaB [Photobacterium nomapromontoriensis]|uniref:Flp pilus assembly protein CpaB n=1 Tax=Photobacterium nomapromontoriensis TaxID=2910237 RepID=UPI003D1251A2
MNGKVIFLIAFLAVISGVYGLIGTLRSSPERAENDAPERQVHYVTLWRANTELAKGTPLTPARVTREQVEMGSALKLGFNEDVELDFTPTVLLNTSIKQGEWIWSEFQTRPEQPGYIDLLISEGMTLYPLQVTTRNLIANFIHPGDHIDILAVSSPKVNLAVNSDALPHFSGVEASIFLHNVKVMSIGTERSRLLDDEEANRAVSAQQVSDNEGKTTVVVEIAPSDIARLSLAQRTMHIEVYRSYRYQQPLHADVRDVIKNYTGIEELRGPRDSSSSLEGVL